jgi:predicted transcriptional regulator
MAMPHEALFLSVKPRFAERIVAGTKTVELRRVRPRVVPNQQVLIYSSSPRMELVAAAFVVRVVATTPSKLWPSVGNSAGIGRTEYRRYFAGATTAAAIWLRDVKELELPVPLTELRRRWPGFEPPQSYCFVCGRFSDLVVTG